MNVADDLGLLSHAASLSHSARRELARDYLAIHARHPPARVQGLCVCRPRHAPLPPLMQRSLAPLIALVAFRVAPALRLGPAVPRLVHIEGRAWVTSGGEPIVLAGPNVVVKGPPYLPTVINGAPVCSDRVDDACSAAGTCESCTTFSLLDVANFRAHGWNAMRLGVVWAGAQPRDEDALDPGFLARLHDMLNLTDAAGIAVVLDNHGDMTSSLSCGNGVPAWLQLSAAGAAGVPVGQPLVTAFPFSDVPGLNVSELQGYSTCGSNVSAWAAHAGDPLYNLLSPCCQVCVLRVRGRLC